MIPSSASRQPNLLEQQACEASPQECGGLKQNQLLARSYYSPTMSVQRKIQFSHAHFYPPIATNFSWRLGPSLNPTLKNISPSIIAGLL